VGPVSSSTFIRVCRIALGLVLLGAALAKIGHPGAFATQIDHFRLIPVALGRLLAVTLPWIELLTGIALITGLRARAGAWLGLAMMVVFTLAVAQAMVRGLNFECGCFGSADATRIGLKKLIENIALTAVALLAGRRL
jgi:uncharacterized membrane protein YphA (DoxX/SURF4 family)